MIVISSLLRTVSRAWSRMNDPVCQNRSAVMFGTYRDKVVRLVPVMDEHEPTRIADWVPDPDESETVDAMISEEERKRQQGALSLPVLPRTASVSTTGFNPALSGL